LQKSRKNRVNFGRENEKNKIKIIFRIERYCYTGNSDIHEKMGVAWIVNGRNEK
jgi:hypothetical protein